MHLMLDGIATRNLADEHVVARFITEAASLIGMNIVLGPVVKLLKNENGCGISAFAIIAQSNIAVHTFPENGYIYVDVFSCGDDFDRAAIRRLLIELFGFEARFSLALIRGREHQLV